MRPAFAFHLAPLLSLAAFTGCSGDIGGDDHDGGVHLDARVDARVAATDASTDTGSAAPDGGSDGIGVRFFNVMTGAPDPRFASLPSALPLVQLLPRVTFVADVSPAVLSVRFTVDGEVYLDRATPFRAHEDASGAARPWSASVGVHTITVETFSASDGTGPLTTSTPMLELTAAGMDPTPGEGAHTTHLLWRTSAGEYVHRDGAGNYVNQAGTRVLAASDVRIDDRGGGQVFLVSNPGLPSLDFAFTVMLPDGFDSAVEYPMLFLLHHGGEDYRGTDNDSSLTRQPPLTGPRSLTSSGQRHAFAAVILIPQLPFHGAMGGFNHEWAAFTSIDGAAGNSHSADDFSIGSRYALDALTDLISGDLQVDGARVGVDEARLYMTGHSMGGLGTWDLVARQPDYWAAAIPMAGYPDHARADRLVDTPIWAFHHRIDCYNAFVGTETMHRLITEVNGGTVMRFTAQDFDTGGACDQAHFQTPDRAFQDETLFPWIFSQVNGRL